MNPSLRLLAPAVLLAMGLAQGCSKNNDVTPPPHACANGLLDDGEGDTDCGGACESKCKLGQSCNLDVDCSTSICSQHQCVAASCSDGRTDGDETDADCGGPGCKPCDNGKHCKANGDCLTSFCLSGTCKPPTCTDNEKNGTETDVDCGGMCRNDNKLCTDGRSCQAAADCQSGVCKGGACATPTCSDGVHNQGECVVDKGGPCAGKCDYESPCKLDGDCSTGVCRADSKCGCSTKNDCAGNDSACGTRVCTAGVCSVTNAAAGTVVTQQNAGDCQQVECDGAGGTVSVDAPADVPATSECATAQCSAGTPSVPVVTNKSAGAACAGTDRVCDGVGQCRKLGRYDDDSFDEVLFAP